MYLQVTFFFVCGLLRISELYPVLCFDQFPNLPNEQKKILISHFLIIVDQTYDFISLTLYTLHTVLNVIYSIIGGKLKFQVQDSDLESSSVFF